MISSHCIITGPLANSLSKARETGVQSHVELFRTLKKWHLMPPCLKLGIIMYWSRVKWSDPRKGLPPLLTPRCNSYLKGSLRFTLDYGCQFYLYMTWNIKKIWWTNSNAINSFENQCQWKQTRHISNKLGKKYSKEELHKKKKKKKKTELTN